MTPRFQPHAVLLTACCLATPCALPAAAAQDPSAPTLESRVEAAAIEARTGAASPTADAPATERRPGDRRRRALVVGVGAYPRRTGWPALRGTTLDAESFANALVEHAGFPADQVTLLLDETATREGILGAFERLIAESSADDLLVFFFAGHGSRLPDQDADEVDGWDETLVPFDASGGPKKGFRDIRDDEIARLIEKANTKTDHVVLIFDCCSSGTNTRGGDGATRRFVDPKARGFDAVRYSFEASQEGGSGYVPASSRYVSLSACRATESAYELQLTDLAPDDGGDGGDGDDGGEVARGVATPDGALPPSRGVFTYSLVEALEELGEDVSYADLMVRVTSRVAERTRDIESGTQSPVLEGPLWSYRLFDTVADPRTLRCELEVHADGWIEVDGGLLYGLQPGAVFGVGPVDAVRDTRDTRLARVHLDQVGSARSSASWLDPPRGRTGVEQEALEPGRYSAFLLERGTGDLQMLVAVDAEGRHAQELIQRLEATGVLRHDPERARYRITLQGEDGIFRWRVASAQGTELPLWAFLGNATSVETLVAALKRLGVAWRTEHLLRTPAFGSLFLRCELLEVDDENQIVGDLPRADGVALVSEQTFWTLRVTNLSSVPVFVNVIAFSPDGEVTPIETPTPDDVLAPQQPLVLDRMLLEIPKDGAEFFRDRPFQLLCIATPRHHNLRGLEQKPVQPTVTHAARGIRRAEPPPEIREPIEDEAWVCEALPIRAVRPE